MARQVINRGDFPNDHAHADSIYVINGKINDMTADIYAQLSRTISAGDIRFAGGATTEARIDLGLTQCLVELAKLLVIPAFMLPYDISQLNQANLATFHGTGGRIVREGGDYTVYDVEAYGASPVLAIADSWSTTAIQAALDAQHSQGRGVVNLPGPLYAISNLRYYSNTIIRGAGNPGTAPSGGTQLYQGSAAAKMLEPNDPSVTVENFEFSNFSLSSYGNVNNLGGLDLTNAGLFNVVNVGVTGTAQFGVRVLGGPVDGDSGFGHFDRVVVNLTQANTYAWEISSSATDQPDGLTFTDCYTSTGSRGRFIHYASVGGRHGPGTNSWKGCSFESSSGDGSADILYDSAGAGPNTFTDCRFENTGSGGLQVTLYGFTIHPAAIFTNTLFADGGGGLTWTDNGPILSPRINNHLTAGYVHNQVLGLATAVKIVTDANYTATLNDSVILCSVPGGTKTITLPTAVGCAGRWYRVKKTDNARTSVNIASSGGTIDGASTQLLTIQHRSIDVVSDGTNWLSFGPEDTLVSKQVALTDGANVAVDLRLGNFFYLSAGGSRTITNPSSEATGLWTQQYTIAIKNNTAGAITTTWTTSFGYHLAGAWVDPAAGKIRTITFQMDQNTGVSYETARSAADIDP